MAEAERTQDQDSGLIRVTQALSAWMEKVYARWQIPETAVVITSAVLVGLGTGVGAVIFIWLLRQVTHFTQWIERLTGSFLGVLLVMTLAGLVVGYLIARWASEAKGHGVPEVMEAVALRGGRIRPRVAFVKVIASAITIGAGGSAGREGPIVQVGATLGSTVGQLLRFSNERVRTLVACGGAAGIAATFNTPIAGAIFALEVILGRFTVRYFGAVVISTVTAAVVSRSILGDRLAFNVPAYSLNHLGELPIYVGLGVLSALVAVAYIRVLYRVEDIYDRSKVSLPLKAASGMLITGLIAMLLPGRQILGSGLEFIGESIADDFSLSIGLMLALLVYKLLGTSFTLGSGNSGGVFAPSLFMGAMLGGLVGSIANTYFPDVVTHPGAFALVGMAAVFAGAARAPITAVLIVFEMSNDYRLILPLMLATVIATLLSEGLFKDSIYTLKLKRKGIHLHSGRDEDLLQGVTVEEVMTRKVTSVPAEMRLPELSAIFSATRHHGLVVSTPSGKLWGIVTVTDLDRAVFDKQPEDTRVADIGTPVERLVVAYPDEGIGEVLARMGVRGYGRLPVVSRADPRELVGLIRRDDIVRAYNLAVSRRAELQHRARQFQLRNLDGTEFIEVELQGNDRLIGISVKEVAGELPQECILISVRRDGSVIFPHGSTIFQAGDRITAFVHSEDVEAFQGCFLGEQDEDEEIPNLAEEGSLDEERFEDE